ncbi:MAG: DUF3021 domain-containing protein [Lachnospiraceae bacterium]|nr:DUF3021 domain-containing protein [Lachnospiraceae bacterium]
MSLKERFYLKASIGGILGVFVGVGIASLSGDPVSDRVPLIIQLLLYAGMGVVGNGGSIVYYIESWSSAKATLVHFPCVIVYFVIMGLILDFGPFWMYLIMCGAMAVAYFVIWIVNYIKGKRIIKAMNDELKSFKSRPESDN